VTLAATTVGIDDSVEAAKVIAPLVIRTPLQFSQALSTLYGAKIWLKAEHLQSIGAFKIRGASYAINKLDDNQVLGGVVTCSTGNHGRAVAVAAQKRGINATVCMSKLVPDNKVQAIKALGAHVCIVGDSQDDAEAEALRLVSEQAMVYIPPFDHPHVIAGQGTIGLEILQDLPQVDIILAGLSGGGLLGGIGLAVKDTKPACEIIGVSMDQGPAMVASLAAKRPIQVPEYASLADSLGGGIGLHNQHSMAVVQQVMDHAYLVSELAIAKAMTQLFQLEGLRLEGAAVVGLAALAEHNIDITGKHVVLVLSGCNVSDASFELAQQMATATMAGE
jgi:threonine dehydratase